ncbi:MAG: ribbon-helix-helix protein, CopG family [candidate division NC10 bacterium]|nr:ribbon-helix-helix protein, CopG family [candidate division NC10 bacterium]
MPTSVRLNSALETRLRKLAEREGVPLSALLRRAAARYCDEAAAASLDVRLADVIGAAHSAGGQARRSGEAFRKSLRRRR